MTSLFKPGNVYKWSLIQGHSLVSDEVIEDILSYAFESWTKYLNITIKKSEIKKDTAAHITIGFYSKKHKDNKGQPCKNAFDGKSGKLAHSTYPGFIDSTFIHFDHDEPWLFNDKITVGNYFSKRPLFKTAAIHEVGHILGLPHNNDVNSVMNSNHFRFISRPTKKDIIALQKTLQENPNAPALKEEYKIISYGKTYYQEITIIVMIIAAIMVYRYLPKKSDRMRQFQKLFQ